MCQSERSFDVEMDGSSYSKRTIKRYKMAIKILIGRSAKVDGLEIIFEIEIVGTI